MESPSLRACYPWLTATGLLVLALVAGAFYKDQFREWKDWQRAYISQEQALAVTPEQRAAAAQLRPRIRQIVLPELDRIDRCTTCHLAVEDPGYSGFRQPLAYHPNHDQHPVERFGCTICHQGQGLATTREAAHGHVKHWDRPMLPMKFIEASCAKCHHPADLAQAPKLERGHTLFRDLGCVGCHKVGGEGGNLGPELDGVGARRSPEWLSRHILQASRGSLSWFSHAAG